MREVGRVRTNVSMVGLHEGTAPGQNTFRIVVTANEGFLPRLTSDEIFTLQMKVVVFFPLRLHYGVSSLHFLSHFLH